MIGINIGSLNTSVALGHKKQSALLFHTELLLSETSSRTCPTLLSFNETHRVIGDQASLSLRKNIKSSFQFINRFIGFDPQSAFSKKEISDYFYVGDSFDVTQNKFSCVINGEKKYFYPDEIVVSYLHLLLNSYIFKKNIFCDCFVFSVPDYFTCCQKNAYLKIIQSSGLKKDFHLVNESSAITLYFGYKKYKEYFIKQNIGNNAASIDPTIIKYILFIDAGHSKTSFIFSKLSYNLFHVLDSMTLPFFGGRDFNDEIYKYCCEKFNSEHGIDVSKNKKIKLRLIPPIMKARKALTVNKDAQIIVDSLSDDIDFSLLFTREEYEKLISNKVEIFKKELINFCNRIKTIYPDTQITNVEMAGELMRTPALEKVVKEVLGLEMSKTILIDECISVGSSLYGALLKGCFPIKNFKGIYHLNHYSILYSINNEQITEFIDDHHRIPDFKSLYFDEKYFNNQKINITFYHKKDEIENYLTCNRALLISYDIYCEEILKYNNGLKNLKVTFLVDNIGEVHIKGFESLINNEKSIKINFAKNMIKVVGRELYPSQNEVNNLIKVYTDNENALFTKDQQFINFSDNKNSLESKLYNIKNKVQANQNLCNIKYENKNLLDCLYEIENKLNDNHSTIFDLTPLQNQLDNIINLITPQDVMNGKNRLLQHISMCQNILNQEQNNLNNGQPSRYTPELINEASNMLKHFKSRIDLAFSMDEVNNLMREFDNERIKYF